jgi:pyridoxine 5'-phosphate synthase PdxJ
MSRVKEVAEVGKQIIQKIDEAITQTINARLFYEKYKSLLDKAKEIHEQKYVPLWNKVYNDETTTKQEQEQLRELEKIMKEAWEKLGKAIEDLFKE